MKKYLDFINELKLTKTSSSGYTKEVDNIVDDPTSNKSLSALLHLNNRLKDEEFESNPNIEEIVKKYNLKLKPPFNRLKGENIILSLSNLMFLVNKLKEDGVLHCEYCDAGPLYIYDVFTLNDFKSPYIRKSSFKKVDGATADHKNPISKGGDKFDVSNLCVCCSRCNTLKKDKSYDDWIKLESLSISDIPDGSYMIDTDKNFSEKNRYIIPSENSIKSIVNIFNILLDNNIVKYIDRNWDDNEFQLYFYMDNNQGHNKKQIIINFYEDEWYGIAVCDNYREKQFVCDGEDGVRKFLTDNLEILLDKKNFI